MNFPMDFLLLLLLRFILHDVQSQFIEFFNRRNPYRVYLRPRDDQVDSKNWHVPNIKNGEFLYSALPVCIQGNILDNEETTWSTWFRKHYYHSTDWIWEFIKKKVYPGKTDNDRDLYFFKPSYFIFYFFIELLRYVLCVLFGFLCSAGLCLFLGGIGYLFFVGFRLLGYFILTRYELLIRRRRAYLWEGVPRYKWPKRCFYLPPIFRLKPDEYQPDYLKDLNVSDLESDDYMVSTLSTSTSGSEADFNLDDVYAERYGPQRTLKSILEAKKMAKERRLNDEELSGSGESSDGSSENLITEEPQVPQISRRFTQAMAESDRRKMSKKKAWFEKEKKKRNLKIPTYVKKLREAVKKKREEDKSRKEFSKRKPSPITPYRKSSDERYETF